MGMSATSFSGSGLRDWLLQRYSALILAGYTVFLLFFFVTHPELDFATWVALFEQPVMKIATLLALLGLLIHAWIGVWTVIGDYIHCGYLRLGIYAVVLTSLLASLLWGFFIVWSV